MEKISSKDLAWVAGLLEGEGCFSSCNTGSGGHYGKKRYSYPQIQVTMVDLDVLERLLEIVGIGSITGPHRVRSEHHNPTWGWKVTGAKAAKLMELIKPHMGLRRTARIEEALNDYNPIRTVP